MLGVIKTTFFGKESNHGLRRVPSRVRKSIRQQQCQSEVLIGWMQVGIIIVFATLYAIAPKTFNPNTMFAPVPFALCLYGAFTLVRLLLAYKDWLPRWFLMLSIILDMALLFGLIWSFHLQYAQPPGFYLKAPTLLYVFIFIALRGLRFDARYVIVSGIAAAIGWAVLLHYAIEYHPDGNPLTRDYVQYLTSNAILLGGEFDKIITILVFTAILSLVIIRGRILLIKSANDEAAASELSRFFAPAIASRIIESEERIEAGDGVLRHAAILFVDIRGFSRLAIEETPSETMAILKEYEARMGRVIEAADGTIDKFMGDGIIATFGAAHSCSNYAASALNCVDAIIAEGESWKSDRINLSKKPLNIGAAVAMGDVVFGAVGDANHLDYTVIGPAVNLSAKLEKHNKIAGVSALTTRAVYELACEQGYNSPFKHSILVGQNVEGVIGPLDLVMLAE